MVLHVGGEVVLGPRADVADSKLALQGCRP